MRYLISFSFFSVVMWANAQAEWKPEYALQPKEVRDWYQAAELTPTAQMRFPYKKCCDHADVYRTQFRVNASTNKDEWFYLAGEDWKAIPADIIHWGEHAPDGQPTLFIYNGKETCFFPGDSGI